MIDWSDLRNACPPRPVDESGYVGYPPGTTAAQIIAYRKAGGCVYRGDLTDWEPDYRHCTMGVGCDEVGVCYAEAHDQPERCPSYPKKRMIDYNEPISDAGHVVGDGLSQRVKDLEAELTAARASIETLRELRSFDAVALTAARERIAALEETISRYREAISVDVKMEGAFFMGVNRSALKRAWEADQAAIAPGKEQPFAFCCSSFDIAACDCVNKNHGTARRG